MAVIKVTQRESGDKVPYNIPDVAELAAAIAALNIEETFLAAASVNVQDVNDNEIVQLTATREDTGWTIAANIATYTGNPNSVEIMAQVHQSSTGQRAAPQLKLQKLVSGTWMDIAISSTGYMRNGTGQNESSNTIAKRDESPGANPQYRLFSIQESSNGNPANTTAESSFSLKAIVK